MKKRVVIIILNLNGIDYLRNCLKSIRENTNYKNYKIIVVDNNSTDGSKEMIQLKFDNIDLIKNKINRGFSGGNNDGIKYAIEKYNPEYFYLLNNDTLVKKNWLSEAIKVLKKTNAGIVGSKQLNFNEQPTISAGWIRRFNVKYYYGDKEKEVGWVSGAGFMIKRDVIESIGMLDEIYNPAYYEETDFEKRAINKGFKIVHAPKSIFLHAGGKTFDKEFNNFSEIFYRNRFIYFMRYYGLIYFIPRILSDILKQFKSKGITGVKKLFKYYRIGWRLDSETNEKEKEQ